MLYMLGLAALLGTYNNVHMIGFASAKEMNTKSGRNRTERTDCREAKNRFVKDQNILIFHIRSRLSDKPRR